MRLAVFLLSLFFSTSGFSAPEPEALVRKITAEVLAELKSDEALQAGDKEKAIALAEKTVLQHLDLEEERVVRPERRAGRNLVAISEMRRHPELVALARIVEPGRHDADDGEGLAVGDHGAADDRAVAPEPSLPQRMTEQHHVVAARGRLLAAKRAS